ncbi:cAMP-dependent protein kinase catalytic subunit alpha-like [Hylaeus volcanicus]|uniref:cAMP-dependent protein kinase catalytic subunit alpha-like n=1 Tax=Hylaeus volcanicus TaxID=313075 RepID=UPI0023B7EB4F|nr:cAMP-dependent protein kinase catalytic subunit alpha-like [Hylaeus volcanicus]
MKTENFFFIPQLFCGKHKENDTRTVHYTHNIKKEFKKQSSNCKKDNTFLTNPLNYFKKTTKNEIHKQISNSNFVTKKINFHWCASCKPFKKHVRHPCGYKFPSSRVLSTGQFSKLKENDENSVLLEERHSITSVASTCCDFLNRLDAESSGISTLDEELKISSSDADILPSLSHFNTTLIALLGVGTFGRVYLARHAKNFKDYYALKIIKKVDIVRLKQEKHVATERQILQTISHPFIVSSFGSFETANEICIMMEYVPAGELFHLLQKYGRLSNELARFYVAELVTALRYLHSCNIVYRDIKPENILIDKYGHIKLIDFGFSKYVKNRTWTLCGTPEYLAPEVLLGKGHNQAADWWTVGILIYELLTGHAPFQGDSVTEIYKRILSHALFFPQGFNTEAKDLVTNLLNPNPQERLNFTTNTSNDIRSHVWFSSIDWLACERKLIKPPSMTTNYQNNKISTCYTKNLSF